MISLMGNALWHLVRESDGTSKFVLLSLVFLSIACWSIFIYKIILFRVKKRHLAAARKDVKLVATLEQLITLASSYAGTMPGYFITRSLASVKAILEVKKEQAHGVAIESSAVQQAVADITDEMMVQEESYMAVLSTSVTVSPLIGLFGTVWGLVHAFIRISQKQTADIVTVAPGIAEALITTLAGLMVAIPALIMFNYCAMQIRSIEQETLKLADSVRSIIQKQLIRGVIHDESKIKTTPFVAGSRGELNAAD